MSQEPVYRNANIYIKASICSVYSKLLKQCVQTNTGVPRGVPGTMPQFVMLPNYASIVDSKLFNCNLWANPGSSEGFQSLI